MVARAHTCFNTIDASSGPRFSFAGVPGVTTQPQKLVDDMAMRL